MGNLFQFHSLHHSPSFPRCLLLSYNEPLLLIESLLLHGHQTIQMRKDPPLLRTTALREKYISLRSREISKRRTSSTASLSHTNHRTILPLSPPPNLPLPLSLLTFLDQISKNRKKTRKRTRRVKEVCLVNPRHSIST